MFVITGQSAAIQLAAFSSAIVYTYYEKMNIPIIIFLTLFGSRDAYEDCNSKVDGHLEEEGKMRRVLNTDEAAIEIGIDGSDVSFRLENENKIGNDRDYFILHQYCYISDGG